MAISYSRTITSQKILVGASIAAMSVVGLLTVAAPANADPPIDPVTEDNVSVSITPGLVGVSVQVTNSSKFSGNCTYDAKAGPLGPLVAVPPPITHRDFTLGAFESKTLQIPGVPTQTTYDVFVSCLLPAPSFDEFGHVHQVVTF